ncbi:hypothetical protein L3Y34_016031 [Caenorhabditis briggsae]|uniref:Uncharacterized protein n=1 Tax=Caenorhabditis briggsae TaxID=6238 RepID=A0AAE9DWJ4_CAEBR|nr:hypothetical protein L3Y34_016031 [Caenorhabditis briggsae]
MSWINYIPVLGTAKGVVQCIKGDTEEGVQAMKDSVKIPVITTYVTFMQRFSKLRRYDFGVPDPYKSS